MKAIRMGRFIRAGSAVYMGAVIEYLLAEVLELAGNCARDNKRKSIKPRHMMMAVEMDDELKPLFGGANVILPGGGVVPGIYSCLTNKVDQNTFKGWSRQNLSKAGAVGGITTSRPGDIEWLNDVTHSQDLRLLVEMVGGAK